MTDDTTATGGPTAEDGDPVTGDDADWPPSADAFDDLPDRLAERTVPLGTTDPDADLSALDPLGDWLGDARVVGLGEATHGTREFFQVKHRVIRYLVERLDYRIVALEANFAETLAIDEYVVHGRGDPRDALEGIYFWTWDTEEVLALLEWLRAFNEGRPIEDCVRFYGFDAQFTAGPAEALHEFLADRDAEFLADHRDTLGMLVDEGLDVEDEEDEVEDTDDSETDAGGEDEPDESGADGRDDESDRSGADEVFESRIADARALLDDLEAWFAEHAGDDEGPVGAGDGAAAERELHRRHYRTLEQAVERYRLQRDGDTEGGVTARDRAMAENLQWVLEHERHDRVAVWAHDEHLQTGSRDRFWGTGPSMGVHLAERYGDEYYVLGFDFADGEFQAIGPAADGDGQELGVFSLGPPPADAATRLFATVADAPWMVDFDGVTADERLADYFDRERPVRSLGAIYDPENEHDRLHDSYRLPEVFDGLVFVGETTHARPVERN